MRYPDTPCREIDPIHLADMPGWICKLKIDGWRCMVHRLEGQFTYLSKSLKPLAVPNDVRLPFEKYVSGIAPANCILDCELTGNRRSQDAAGIFLLDIIRWQGSREPMIASDRWELAQATLPRYAVPSTLTGFRAFFDAGKADPLAEGVILMKGDSKYAGGKYACVMNLGTIKCKWRAGQAGTTVKGDVANATEV